MEKITILYEEHPGLDGIEQVPMKMIIRFGRGNMDWEKPSVYFPVTAPFEQYRSDEYDDEIMGLILIQSDLIRNSDLPNQFGVSLSNVVERMEKTQLSYQFSFDFNEIEQFIVQIDDLEEVLRMNIRRQYEWR